MSEGLLVVDKPSGWTSHQVVGRVRRLAGTRKVGHAGTLDPMATGVLLVGVNRATRLLGHLAGHDKTYTATIRLGQSTHTDDAEGDLVSATGASDLAPAVVEAAIQGFRGVITQVPSAVSAIKVNGERAYALVRRGESVDLAGRQVTVSRFEVTGRRDTTTQGLAVIDLDVVVDCSSGTYIRALARDLGATLGTGGHLTRLRRTRIGGFGEELISLDAEGLAAAAPPALLSMAEVARRAFPWREVSQAEAKDIGYGRPVGLELSEPVTALLHEETLLALYRPDDERGAVPVAVLV